MIQEEIIRILKKDSTKQEKQIPLTFKITYSNKGVKVNIDYISRMGLQKKPYPTLIEALHDALVDYNDTINQRIESIKKKNNNNDELFMYTLHKPNAEEALKTIQTIKTINFK